MTRRSLLASAPLLAGAAAFPQARPLIIGGPPPPTPPEIVNNCGNVFVSLAPKFAARTYTWADIQSFLATLATFNLQMGPFAFDNSVRAMAATINPYTISTTNPPWLAQVQARIHSPAVTLPMAQSAYVRTLPVSQIGTLHQQILANGGTPALNGAYSILKARPEDFWFGDPGPDPTFCTELNFYQAWLALAIGELGLGCLPDNPFFIEICGIITILGVIWFIFSVITQVACL